MASVSIAASPLIFRKHNFRRNSKSHCNEMACACPSLKPTSRIGVFRRDFVLVGLTSSVAPVFSSLGIGTEEDIRMAASVDETNAYTYLYPVALPSKKLVFKWAESRRPERYSSAAPLSPDARLRIVSERVDIMDNLVISVTIGPPNSLFLKSKDKSTWTAKDVADSVFSDKFALRVTSSQRVAESTILDTHTSEIDGEPYWYYEYLVRKSPTKVAGESNTYRQFVSATAERDGFLYTVNASTLSKQWDMMGPLLKRTADSFRLLPPTDAYVPPYKDPWRFW